MGRVATEYGATAKRVLVSMAKIGKVQALLTDPDPTIRSIGQKRCEQARKEFDSAASALLTLAGGFLKAPAPDAAEKK